MKTKRSNNKYMKNLLHLIGRSLGAALLVSLLSATPASVFAGNPNPGILPINSQPHGNSYGSWAAAWWQWALGIPEAQNPLLDTTGQYAGVNQNGPVFFLAGTIQGSAERNVTIPAGKSIFMPVHNWIFGAGVFDCDPTVPGVTCDVPTLREKAAAATTSVQSMEVTIDGVAVQKLQSYRAMSPDTFSVNFPVGAVFGIPAGTLSPHVADGYWLMLTPLTPGSHTIHVHVTNPDYGIEQDILDHITVK